MSQAISDQQTTTIRQYRHIPSILAERLAPVNLVMSSSIVPIHIFLNIEKVVLLAKPTDCSRSIYKDASITARIDLLE